MKKYIFRPAVTVTEESTITITYPIYYSCIRILKPKCTITRRTYFPHAHHFIFHKAFKQDICSHHKAKVDLSTTDQLVITKLSVQSMLSGSSQPYSLSFSETIDIEIDNLVFDVFL